MPKHVSLYIVSWPDLPTCRNTSGKDFSSKDGSLSRPLERLFKGFLKEFQSFYIPGLGDSFYKHFIRTLRGASTKKSYLK
jgi:hypothetical protein